MPRCSVCGGAAEREDRFGPAPLYRCPMCGFMQLEGDVDPSLYGDGYFEQYAGGDYLQAEQQRRKESRIRLDLLARAVPPPARLLEIGSAAGFFLDEARTRGYDVVGVEPNEAMAGHARDELALDVRVGVLDDAQLDPASFDAACAFHVVEHLADPRQALAEVAAALRPGGHLLVEVPNAASRAARRLRARWAPLDLPFHVGHHGPASLRTLLESAGFEILLLDSIPFAVYGASSRAELLARNAFESLRVGTVLPAGPHPDGHQLLRALARRSG